MANRFFTILIIPEKTQNVKKWVIPSWIIKGSLLISGFVLLMSAMMILDYWYVMNQISENKQLRLENRRLRQQVQVFKNKITTVESTLDRIKTFATRLKVITNIEDRGSSIQGLNDRLPEAQNNIGKTLQAQKDSPNASKSTASQAQKPTSSSSSLGYFLEDPENLILKTDIEQIENQFSILNYESLNVEQVLQDQYELLADQKAFLSALPTRKPAVGYFTSGFGVRKSPYGGKVKMHEGLDIANFPGTLIKAPADGEVIYATGKPGYGQTLILDHGYGLETWYGHTRKILVSVGQKVKRGETIALLGNSGRSTGPHLHYEVRVNGIPVDPLTYILEN